MAGKKRSALEKKLAQTIDLEAYTEALHKKTHGTPVEKPAKPSVEFGRKDKGRPTLLTDARVEEIERAVEMGKTWRLVAEHVGIRQETLHEWRKQGKADVDAGLLTPFSVFYQRLTRAERNMTSNCLKSITMADDWRAQAWMLERRYPDDYGKRVAVTGKGGAPIQQEVHHSISTETRATVYRDGEASRALNVFLSRLSDGTGTTISSGPDDAGQSRPDTTRPSEGDN